MGEFSLRPLHSSICYLYFKYWSTLKTILELWRTTTRILWYSSVLHLQKCFSDHPQIMIINARHFFNTHYFPETLTTFYALYFSYRLYKQDIIMFTLWVRKLRIKSTFLKSQFVRKNMRNQILDSDPKD